LNASSALRVIGLVSVALGIYGSYGCSRPSSKPSEEKPAPSIAVAVAPSSSTRERPRIPEETVRRELGKMTAFFKWVSDAHRGIAKQKYRAAPECDKDRCRATFEAPENQSYLVEWAKKDQQAQKFESSFGPVKATCPDIDGQPVRSWNTASARKILCKGNSGGNVVIEMDRGTAPATKLVVYTDRYLTIDPDFAAVVRKEGLER
jgi:hypothetical protein